MALAYNGNFSVFNIGTGVPTSLTELISYLENLLGKEAIIADTKGLTPETHSCLDIDLAKKELHWVPKIELVAGLEETTRFPI